MSVRFVASSPPYGKGGGLTEGSGRLRVLGKKFAQALDGLDRLGVWLGGPCKMLIKFTCVRWAMQSELMRIREIWRRCARGRDRESPRPRGHLQESTATITRVGPGEGPRESQTLEPDQNTPKPVHVHVCVGVCIRVCVADMLRVWLGVDCKMLINMSRCCRLTV